MPDHKLERKHTDQFLKLLFGDETIAVCQEAPEPDFLVFLEGRRIGIEHTRLLRGPDSKGIDLMAHSQIAKKIVDIAERRYNEKHNTCLNVGVDFRCDYGLYAKEPIQLYNTDIQLLSKFIGELVATHASYLKDYPHGHKIRIDNFNMQTGKHDLPPKIREVSIINNKEFNTQCWYARQGGTVPGIYDSQELGIILSKKNRKPSNYLKAYDETWLLIVEDDMNHTSYFHFEEPERLIQKSAYDKVYVLRRSQNVIVELKQHDLSEPDSKGDSSMSNF